MDFVRRTWAEISLDSIIHNYKAIKACVSSKCRIMAVVKADGYGHGALPVAHQLKEQGADYFGVSNIEEAIALRKGGISDDILILGYTPSKNVTDLFEYSITQTVFSHSYAKELSAAAKKADVRIKAHLKLDTGMARLGFIYYSENDLLDEACEALSLENLYFEGIFTHFSSSDSPSAKDETENQFMLFNSAVKSLCQKGFSFQYRHCCNSGAILDFPNMHLDMVRPGVILYGLLPSSEIKNKLDLKPSMALKTAISQIKTVDSGVRVSYGGTYETDKKTVLATLPIGYADGFFRAMSNKGFVLIGGKPAPIVGRICMDQMLVDITQNPDCSDKTVATVIGTDGGGQILAEDLARLSGTINYEIVCDIGKRVPRIYIKDGKETEILNYIV